MLGVLAFGDSITNGGGELQWGVALQSWALWTARALGLPYTPYATDGADLRTVRDEQIPAFEQRAAAPAGPYDLGCLYIGTNDVRGFDWDPFAYERGLRRGDGLPCRALRAHADGDAPARPRPSAGRCEGAGRERDHRALARETGALVVDLAASGAAAC